MNNISVFLRGGLGNQFFQFVYAHWLAENGYPVFLDEKFLRRIKKNQAVGENELLRIFDSLQLPLVSSAKIGRLEPVVTRLWRGLGIMDDDITAQQQKAGPALYQYGYFQTQRYWTSSVRRKIAGQLKDDFRRPIMSQPYMAIHIRSGDYGVNSYNLQKIGKLSIVYYEAVFALMRKKQPNLPLIIVSDDYKFAKIVRERLISQDSTSSAVQLLPEILNREDRPDDALRAMICSKYLAVANSSFSAMAAYLGEHQGVVAPSPWFRGAELSYLDPVQISWMRMPASFSDFF
jgi:hypothetical protein